VSGAEAVADLIKGFDEPKGGVTCGTIPELDRVLGKLRKKQLIILGARPGMGKTAVAVSYAVGAAKQGFGVLFVSLEMSSRELAGRMVADLCWTGGDNSVPYQAIVDQRLSDFHMRRVCEAESRMHGLPLEIIDASTLKTGQLKRLIKRHKRRFESRGQNLDLVIVDYMQLMHTDHRANSQYERISEISQSLKATAKGFDVAVMALAQLSREVEKRPGKRPIRSDLRDSGQIEQDADTILFLLREEYYLNEARPPEASPKFLAWQESMDMVKGRIEFIVAKQRAGREGFAVGTFHAEYQAVR
jgi:replicative DNA helicase